MKKSILLIIFLFLTSAVFAEQEFPKFIQMEDLFHAKMEHPSGEKSEMFAWWNIWGVMLIGLNILFRVFRKIWSNSVEPAFFLFLHYVSIGVCLYFFGFQMFCNIFQFDWRMLLAFTALLFASIWSGMMDFEFMSRNSNEDEYEYKNLKPKISFMVLMAIFFVSQFVNF